MDQNGLTSHSSGNSISPESSAGKQKISALYLCYFGLREPLVQTQVIPYLKELAGDKYKIHLLTFEPELDSGFSEQERAGWRSSLGKIGIEWRTLKYHKWPSLPATLYDIIQGAIYSSQLVWREKIRIIHGRGYVPAVMGALTKSVTKTKLIFDIRGFMAEEYVDAGIWLEAGLAYRLTKAAEKLLLSYSDGFVVLTERAKDILFPGAGRADSHGRPVEVIPCCVDLERFRQYDILSREEIRRELNLNERLVIIYVGALGGWYLTDEMAEFIALANQQNDHAFSLILTQSDPAIMIDRLRRLGLNDTDYRIMRSPPEEIPRYLKAADFAISFIKPGFSKLSSSPTKIGEYLLGGLPVISNTGIGDLDEVIETNHVGVIIRDLNRNGYLKGLSEIKGLLNARDIRERCRLSAQKLFDLKTVGGMRYKRLYKSLS